MRYRYREDSFYICTSYSILDYWILILIVFLLHSYFFNNTFISDFNFNLRVLVDSIETVRTLLVLIRDCDQSGRGAYGLDHQSPEGTMNPQDRSLASLPPVQPMMGLQQNHPWNPRENTKVDPPLQPSMEFTTWGGALWNPPKGKQAAGSPKPRDTSPNLDCTLDSADSNMLDVDQQSAFRQQPANNKGRRQYQWAPTSEVLSFQGK